MRKHIRYLLVTLVVLLLSQRAYAEVVELDFLAINDLHGNILATEKSASLGQIATWLIEQRNKNPQGTVLLSAGDMHQGSMQSNLFFGRSVVDVMNYLQFDAMTVGNHEFDWGIDKLNDTRRLANFPYVSCNIVDKATGELVDWVIPYTVIERQGVKVAIIGAATFYTAQTTNPQIVKNLNFTDPVPLINDIAKRLKANNVDIIVVLGHMGFQGIAPKLLSGEAVDDAKRLQNVDLFFAGHIHEIAYGDVNNILLLQDYAYGRAVGCVVLKYDTDAKQVVEKTEQVVKADVLKKLLEDSGTIKILAPYIGKVQAKASEVIAFSSKNVESRNEDGDLAALTSLGMLTADIMRATAGTDIAIVNRNSIRTALDPGNVTYGKIYDMFPFDNTLCTLRLTGAQIRKTLEFSTNIPNGVGTIVEFSGLKVVCDVSEPYKNDISSITLLNGQALNDDQYYSVAVSDFMLAGGDGFTILSEGQDIINTQLLIRDIMLDSLRKMKNINVNDDQRLILTKGQELPMAA